MYCSPNSKNNRINNITLLENVGVVTWANTTAPSLHTAALLICMLICE